MKLIPLAAFFLFLAVPGFREVRGETAGALRQLDLKTALRLAEENTLLREEFAHAIGFFDQRERERWRKLYLPALTLNFTERSGNLTGQERAETA